MVFMIGKFYTIFFSDVARAIQSYEYYSAFKIVHLKF